MAAQPGGEYRARSLESEGFIHCSTQDQWPRVLGESFAGTGQLVLLEIDSTRLAAELRWEDSESTGELFPHLYGPVEVGAVIAVHALRT